MDVSSKDLFEDTVCTFLRVISFGMVRCGHLQSRSEESEHGLPKICREPRVTVGHEFTGYPWIRNILSIKTRAQTCVVMGSGTAARCTILLNWSTNTRITIFLWSSPGKPKAKSMETGCQHSTGTGRGCKSARDEVIGFACWQSSQSRMYLRTD